MPKKRKDHLGQTTDNYINTKNTPYGVKPLCVKEGNLAQLYIERNIAESARPGPPFKVYLGELGTRIVHPFLPNTTPIPSATSLFPGIAITVIA